MTHVSLSKAGAAATILFKADNGVCVFSSRVLSALQPLIADLAADRAVRFVAFRAEGKVFVAGADISEMSSFGEQHGADFGKLGHATFDAIAALPQVTAALINGHALGGGCELALACDLRIAVASAKLGQPECKLGLIPGWGGTQRLPRLIGLAKARRLLFTGEQVVAEAALALGLIDEVAPDAAGLDAAWQRWQETLAGSSPAALARIKRALCTGDEIREFSACFGDADSKEGIAAFLGKRAPVWPRG